MSLSLSVGAFLLSLLIGKLMYGWIIRERKLKDIPGPKGWPLVGNSLQIDSLYPHKTFTKWSKVYGAMFKIRIFHEEVVILNDYESIRELLTSLACSSRPYVFRTGIVLKELTGKDIIFSNFSAEWNERKKTLSRSLNAYGTGAMKIESITLRCIDELFGALHKDSNAFTKAIDIKPYIHRCIVAVITTLLFGRELAESEITEVIEFERQLMKLASPAGPISVLDHFPWVRHFPIKVIQEPIKAADGFMKWIMKRLMEWKCDPKRNEQSILYSLMQHVNKITAQHMTQEELAGMTHNIVVAGFSTSTASLYSLILVLINLPEIQEKMYLEIQHVTEGRRLKVSDRSNMPYVRAVMEENLRFSTVVPYPSHCCMEDTTLNGRHIPKGTFLIPNMWDLHHDERYFDDPWTFNPERFLDADGQMLASFEPVCKHSLPFGFGRRICPGEGLARSRTFLIIASLLQKYRFVPQDKDNTPLCDPREFDDGFVVAPFNYKLKVVER